MARGPESRTSWPLPFRPRLSAGLNYAIHRFLEPNGLYRRMSALIERVPLLRRLFTRAEKSVKEAAFGCAMCGQCALPTTGYACPQTCPKQLRNGPCGGVSANGDCEVHPGTACVWVLAFERTSAAGHDSDLDRMLRPLDHRMVGTSSWLNYWQGRDKDLWTEPGAAERGEVLWPTIAVGR